MKLKFFFVSLFSVTLGVVCLAQSAALSLGDLARKTRAEKKAVMVFDDDNTTRSVPAAQTSATSGNQGAENSNAAKSPHDPAKEGKQAQASKADPGALDARVAQLQKQLDTLKKDQGTWSDSEKQYEDKLSVETDEFRRNTYQEALDNDRNNADLFKKKIEQTQAELAKAQDAAAAAAKQNTQPQGEAGQANSK